MECLAFLLILIVGVRGEFQYFRDSKASESTVCTSATTSKTFCASEGCGSNELIICLGPNFGVSINCSAQYPYCVEEIPGEAQCKESCGSDFACTGEGIFPDPEDCKKYHFCQNVNSNLFSQSYSCPDRYVFDPDAATFNYCRYTNKFYCTLPKCGNSNQMKNVLFLYPFYPFNRQYVALCIPSSKPIVFKCKDGFVADLSTIPITCNFKCKSPGLFPNPDDLTKYFECYYNSNRQLVMRPGNCFPAYVFVNDRCQIQSTTASKTTSTSTQLELTTPTSTHFQSTSSVQNESTTPTQSEIECTTPVPTQSETESTTTVPTQSETESTALVPTQTETESTTSVPTQSETESTTPVPTQFESESTAPVPSQSESTTQECIRPPCN